MELVFLLFLFSLNGLIFVGYVNHINRQEALLKEAIKQLNVISISRGNR